MLDKLIYAPLIQQYVDLMAPVSESPSEFHISVLTHVISAIIGRNFYIQQGHQRIYPNLFTIVIGKTSQYHKSTVCERMIDILQQTDNFQHYLGKPGSPEGLLSRLQDNGYEGTAHIYYDELGELFSSMKKTFMSNMMELMNELYGCPTKYNKHIKKEKESYNLENVYLTLLGATRHDALTSNLQKDQLLSGFLARFFVCYSENLRQPIVWRPPIDKDKEREFLNSLTELGDYIKQLKDENNPNPNISHMVDGVPTILPMKLDVNQEAINKFVWWGERLREKRQDMEIYVDAMYGKLETLILKLAIIVHMAQLDFDNRTIDVETMKKAIQLSNFHVRGYQKLIGEDLHFDKHVEIRDKVEKYIKKKETVYESTLYNYFRSESEYDIGQAIRRLEREEKIKIEHGERKGVIISYLDA